MANRIKYINELDCLIRDVELVGAQLQETLDEVINNLVEKNEILAKKIIKNDVWFNKAEHDINEKCLRLVLTQAPVATDWREIASIMKMIGDIERIADHCADISKYTLYLSEKPVVKLPAYFDDMINVMREMVQNSKQCFTESNVDLAQKIIDTDSEVDSYFRDFREDVAGLIKENPEDVEQYIDYLMIAKYVERIADHATNIAEWIIYLVKNELR